MSFTNDKALQKGKVAIQLKPLRRKPDKKLMVLRNVSRHVYLDEKNF